MVSANVRWRRARDPISQLLVSAATREREEGDAARGRGSCQCRSLTRSGSTRPPPYITTDNECRMRVMYSLPSLLPLRHRTFHEDILRDHYLLSKDKWRNLNVAYYRLESIQGY